MITGFHHTSFTVSNVEEAERFFVELFGLERRGGGTFEFESLRRIVGFPDAALKISYLTFPETQGSRPPHLLELIEYVRPAGEPNDTATNRPGNAHLSFQVNDIHREYERLSALGVRFKSAPQPVTWGANKGAWSVYCNGPDGIALELTQPPAAVQEIMEPGSKEPT
jgi:catechol 2,3-dioxygenase-like lactoylglutathione lyase family enzyme